MKKFSIITVISLFLCFSAFSQTWTAESTIKGERYLYIYSVITENEFNSNMKQAEINGDLALLKLESSDTGEDESIKIVSGKKPTFTDTAYLKCTVKGISKKAKTVIDFMSIDTFVCIYNPYNNPLPLLAPILLLEDYLLHFFFYISCNQWDVQQRQDGLYFT